MGTNADHQRAWRERQKAKIAELEAALRKAPAAQGSTPRAAEPTAYFNQPCTPRRKAVHVIKNPTAEERAADVRADRASWRRAFKACEQDLAQAKKELAAAKARIAELEARREQPKAGADAEDENAELRDENYAFRVELAAWNRVIKTRDGGGLTKAQYRMLQMLGHPDDPLSEKKKNEAIRLINQLQYVLCNEAELPSMDPQKFHLSSRKLWERRQETIKRAKKDRPKASPKPSKGLPKS